jgi:hypothetical protein
VRRLIEAVGRRGQLRRASVTTWSRAREQLLRDASEDERDGAFGVVPTEARVELVSGRRASARSSENGIFGGTSGLARYPVA